MPPMERERFIFARWFEISQDLRRLRRGKADCALYTCCMRRDRWIP
jgi:hypothetical protein